MMGMALGMCCQPLSDRKRRGLFFSEIWINRSRRTLKMIVSPLSFSWLAHVFDVVCYPDLVESFVQV